MDGAEEVVSAFIVSGCDGPILLEFGKEVLDQVPGLIQVLIVFALFFAV